MAADEYDVAAQKWQNFELWQRRSSLSWAFSYFGPSRNRASASAGAPAATWPVVVVVVVCFVVFVFVVGCSAVGRGAARKVRRGGWEVGGCQMGGTEYDSKFESLVLRNHKHNYGTCFNEMKKEGRKKQARSYKQQGKTTQHTQGSHFF